MSPIYVYQCLTCETEVEKILPIGSDNPICHGESMLQLATFPVMVKMKGEGGYPSRRKQWKGTAPFTSGFDSSRDPNSEFYEGKVDTSLYGQTTRKTPSYMERVARHEGRKWQETYDESE